MLGEIVCQLMYMHAKCFYETKNYYTANYQCERFASSYPDSEKAQEMAFLGVKSYYYLAPIFSKDSKETLAAIEKLQSFINTYPFIFIHIIIIIPFINLYYIIYSLSINYNSHSFIYYLSLTI